MAVLLDQARSVAEPQPRSDDQATRLRDLVDSLRATRPETPVASHEARRPAVPVIVFASGKGGVGKTCTAVNTAAAMAQAGLRVTLLDADMGTANADVLCGVNPRRRLDAWKTSTLDRLATPTDHGFSLVPGPTGAMADLSSPERARLASRLAELDNTCDTILIDAGAGIGPSVRAVVGAADFAVVVTGPEPTSIADAYALIKVTIRAPAGAPRPSRMGVLVNLAESESQAEGVYARIAAVADRFLGFRPAYLGRVARDEAVGASVKARNPLVCLRKDSPAAVGWASLARVLCVQCGLESRAPTAESGLQRSRGLFGRENRSDFRARVK